METRAYMWSGVLRLPNLDVSLSFLLNVHLPIGATLVPPAPQCTQRKQDFQPMADRVEMISLAARRERQVGLGGWVGWWGK